MDNTKKRGAVVLEKGYAYFDHDEKKYPCVCNTALDWNGFAIPRFTKEVALQVTNDVANHDDNEYEVTDIKIGENGVLSWLEDGERYEVSPDEGGLYSFDGYAFHFVSEKMCPRCGKVLDYYPPDDDYDEEAWRCEDCEIHLDINDELWTS